MGCIPAPTCAALLSYMSVNIRIACRDLAYRSLFLLLLYLALMQDLGVARASLRDRFVR